jgi:Na+/proline symporter/signal transduction histidine kinase
MLVTLGLAYVCCLFLVAWFTDRRVDTGSSYFKSSSSKGLLYALSLSIYCSSWTFYGAVGSATAQPWSHAPIYLGPMILFIFAWPVFKRMVRINQYQRVTSLADYLSARFGKRSSIAILVSIVAVAAVVPYIALQFKALAQAWQMISVHYSGTVVTNSDIQSVPLIAGILAVFTVLFGARRLDGRERHAGVMAAIALESVIKLLAFLIVAWFAIDYLTEDSSLTESIALLPAITEAEIDSEFLAHTLLSGLAILCLPRQFHVSVVEWQENTRLSISRWVFPLYLLCFLIFVIPISQAGASMFANRSDIVPDAWVQMMPLVMNDGLVTVAAFLGGISAATSMAIIAALSVSIMLTNEVVVPLMLRLSAGTPSTLLRLGDTVRRVRRVVIIGIMVAAWWVTGWLSNVPWLTSIGFMSFLAAAQIAPGLLMGLYWERAHGAAIVAGICVGLSLWFYTCVIPSVVAFDSTLLQQGPWGVSWLSPTNLFGVQTDSVIAYATLWSLGFNSLIAIIFSYLLPLRASDRRQARVFLPRGHKDAAELDYSLGLVRVSQLQALLTPLMTEQRYTALWREFELVYEQRLLGGDRAPRFVIERCEAVLADLIGVISAHRAMERLEYGQQLAFHDLAGMVSDASNHNSLNRTLLENAVENLTQGIAVVDRELRLVAWNKRYETLFEYPPRFLYSGCPIERVYRFNAQRGILVPKDTDIEAEISKRLTWLREGSPHRIERTLPNGKVIDIRGNPLPMGGFVTTYIEVSDYHDLLVQLEEAKSVLEAKVASGTQNLLQTNQALRRENRLRADIESKLREAGQSKSHFMSATSHDLLQPIHAARLFTASLQQKMASESGESEELIGQIDRSLERAERLITDLREISRLDSGRQTPEFESVPLLSVLDPVISEFKLQAKAKGLTLRCVPSSVWVRTDSAMLIRVMQNLIGNAIRYTDSGDVLAGVRRRGSVAEIQVLDTGRGIPISEQARVFQEFERISTNAQSEDGLGLGLAIVRRYCDLLEAPLDLRSVEGTGTLFSVTLPRAESNVLIHSERPISVPNHLAGNVLCLDNDPAILAATRTLLKGFGLSVISARNRDELIEVMKRAEPIDLALVDYHLDDGVLGLNLIQTHLEGVTRPFPVIIVTADDSDEIKNTVAAAGFRFMSKPVNPGRLRAVIAALLDRVKPQAAVSGVESAAS